MNGFVIASVLWMALLLGGWLLVGRSLGRGGAYRDDEGARAHRQAGRRTRTPVPRTTPAPTAPPRMPVS